MNDYRWIQYETVDEGSIAFITLNRPKQRNAQSRGLLVELDDAFAEAERDDKVRVVVLRGAGPVFSSGHDLGSSDSRAEREPGPDQHPSFQGWGGTMEGYESFWRQEYEFFYANTKRWRELRKITIASVHGAVYSAALMLMWACDLIVADETATFADVVAARLGMPGVEYFAHPWELGPRRAKELLLTGDYMDAHTAYEIGMVNRVFPAGTLEESTLAFARRIAQVETVAALLVKDSVNQMQDAQGFTPALNAAFTLHELGHAHWMATNAIAGRGPFPALIPKDGLWTSSAILPRSKDRPSAEEPA